MPTKNQPIPRWVCVPGVVIFVGMLVAGILLGVAAAGDNGGTATTTGATDGVAATGGVAVAVIAVIATIVVGGIVGVIDLARTRTTKPHGRRTALSRATHGAARLLPIAVRHDYQEEWEAWLLDLRAVGTPRTQRWVHLLTIVLIAAPQLAITLRMVARRAMDR